MSKFLLHSFLLAVGFCWFTYPLNSQDVKSNHEKREAKRDEMLLSYKVLGSLLESRKFIFEAEYFNFGFSNPAEKELVDSDYNFIKVDSSEAVIMYDLLRWESTEQPGYNIKMPHSWTYEGPMEGWILKENLKKLTYKLQFRIAAKTVRKGPEILSLVPTKNIDVYINIDSDKKATARFDERYVFYGMIVPIPNTIIYDDR